MTPVPAAEQHLYNLGTPLTRAGREILITQVRANPVISPYAQRVQEKQNCSIGSKGNPISCPHRQSPKAWYQRHVQVASMASHQLTLPLPTLRPQIRL